MLTRKEINNLRKKTPCEDKIKSIYINTPPPCEDKIKILLDTLVIPLPLVRTKSKLLLRMEINS